MKRLFTLIAALAIGTGLGMLAGCGNDVQKTEVQQIDQQADPEPVAPGEMIVE